MARMLKSQDYQKIKNNQDYRSNIDIRKNFLSRDMEVNPELLSSMD